MSSDQRDKIGRLIAELEAAKTALEPFASKAALYDASRNTGYEFNDGSVVYDSAAAFVVGDLRASRASLARIEALLKEIGT